MGNLEITNKKKQLSTVRRSPATPAVGANSGELSTAVRRREAIAGHWGGPSGPRPPNSGTDERRRDDDGDSAAAVQRRWTVSKGWGSSEGPSRVLQWLQGARRATGSLLPLDSPEEAAVGSGDRRNPTVEARGRAATAGSGLEGEEALLGDFSELWALSDTLPAMSSDDSSSGLPRRRRAALHLLNGLSSGGEPTTGARGDGAFGGYLR